MTDYCRKYNVGWVVCWSPATVSRFDRWTEARRTVVLEDGTKGWLFTLGEPTFAGRLFGVPRQHSFVLKGQARWLRADASHISLADVSPGENGEVWLSLHYQEGLTVWPSRVKVSKRDGSDPIPLIRLRLDAPVARVTLTWDKSRKEADER